MEKEFTLAFNEVVNDIHDDRTEVTMEAARRYDPNAQYGDMVLSRGRFQMKELMPGSGAFRRSAIFD